jgi:tetratricopeptide (TPR) repeat protein
LNKGRIIMWGSVLAIIAWLLNSEVVKKKADPIKTSEQTDADIKEADKLRQTAETDRKKRVGTTTEIKQAQENYVKGFRDYKKGQYERAVEAFQACLSLYPDHILCNRYLRLAQKRFDEIIEVQMVLGRKYRDQGLYRECMNAFQNVMFMVKDFNSPRYKEAKANFEACNAFVEGRY